MKGLIIVAMMAISLPFSFPAQAVAAPTENAQAGDVSASISAGEVFELFSEDDILKLDKFDAAMNTWLDEQLWFLTQAATARPSLKIYINKFAQTMTVVENGVVKFSHWKISTGVRGHETRSGIFVPYEMNKNYFSKQFKALLPYGIKFDGDNMIYASPAKNSLGRKRTRGSVRLIPANAKILFEMVHRTGLENTLVIVKNAPYQGHATTTAPLPEIAL